MASNGGLGSPVAPAPVARIDFVDFSTDFTSPARPLAAQHVTNESPRQKNLSNVAQLESKFEEGYDSDGQAGPWCDLMATEGEQDFEEDLLIEQMPIEEELTETEDTQQQEGEEQPTALPPLPPPPEVHIPIEDAVFTALKVGALKNELKIRGQSSTGKKTDLKERLRIVLNKEIPVLNLNINKNVMPKKVKKKVETPKGMKTFPISAYWEYYSRNRKQW